MWPKENKPTASLQQGHCLTIFLMRISYFRLLLNISIFFLIAIASILLHRKRGKTDMTQKPRQQSGRNGGQRKYIS